MWRYLRMTEGSAGDWFVATVLCFIYIIPAQLGFYLGDVSFKLAVTTLLTAIVLAVVWGSVLDG